MKILYLIPARGGSKGVPGKNTRLLAGEPLINHSIKIALGISESPEDVVVSTDSVEIAEIARKAGASVPFIRPAELATDTAGSREVIIHALEFLKKEGKDYDAVVLLQPTSPFRKREDIIRALEIFRESNPDMVVSVREARTNPYYNAYEVTSEGTLNISKGDGSITRRQDAPPVWEFDGSIYVINPDSIENYPSLVRMQKIMPVENSSEINIDIDSEIDFKICELLASRLKP